MGNLSHNTRTHHQFYFHHIISHMCGSFIIFDISFVSFLFCFAAAAGGASSFPFSIANYCVSCVTTNVILSLAIWMGKYRIQISCLETGAQHSNSDKSVWKFILRLFAICSNYQVLVTLNPLRCATNWVSISELDEIERKIIRYTGSNIHRERERKWVHQMVLKIQPLLRVQISTKVPQLVCHI